MIEPKTEEQWREAVTLAEVLLDIDAARNFGLLTGGPSVNVDRCVEIVRRGRARMLVALSDDVNAKTAKVRRHLANVAGNRPAKARRSVRRARKRGKR